MMPYGLYHRMSDEDLASVVVYFDRCRQLFILYRKAKLSSR